MEGELQRHSLSNHEDARKPELSEESVAQEATPMEDDEITMEERKNADTKEETDDPMVVAQEESAKTEVQEEKSEAMEQEERMNDEEHFQKEMKRNGKQKAIPVSKKRKISRPASRTVMIREPSQEIHESSSSDSDSESGSESDNLISQKMKTMERTPAHLWWIQKMNMS